ncbi:ATP-binding cassette subfamily B protein [Rhodothalassium salexigens DSM 2132]|uniref:ATP-binding cassette subfamily B protein n=1 Tax=Rhodothalassium salexigens DSM 2132 TaxID=1188247 RepID=A0A4R2P843_RHOSA|nr:ABC transporter ATP-binding protein [Rhodothalassium salexigens]MBB4212527.1 ATP-binding cassette subfamily B protein [Rhodothalassium salexigens DSM 2132]MBK1639661.1 ABC transporter [Rhodothalassium salexigens DSM 2132]TCP31072.1 ATP-binding cassette subfamily B protein [Rhodothalassium salexigens DSM 2132]
MNATITDDTDRTDVHGSNSPPAATAENDGPDYLASLRLIGGYLSASRLKMGASILLATLATACELVPVWAVYRVLDAAIGGALTWPFAGLHALAALGGVVIGYAALGVAMALSHIVAFDAIYRLRLDIARHMARLPLGYFMTRKSGDARKLVIDEPEKLETIVAHGVPEGVSALSTWLAVSVWLFAVDWRMALAAIFVTPVSFVLLTMAMTHSGKRASAYQEAATRMNASIVEYLAGMPVVKIFNRTGESLAETSKAVRDYADIETEWGRYYIPLGGSFYTLVLTNIVFILPVGLLLLQTGTLSLATLLFFMLLGANYSQPLLKLFNQFHTLAHISMGSTIVAELLQTPAQSDTGRRVDFPHYDIAFESVSFGYSDHDVLHGVSFTARTGKITALVGPSGSGKSTVASLVPRFWDVRMGRVMLGGVDVRDIGLDQLMDTVAFVFQNTFLFSDTIAANIRFGNPQASDEEVEAAARAARAHEFISKLPNGYDTMLGEHGAALSGGERQRLAIARALLKNAPVVILDEATAFADPDNEAAIQEAIGELTKGRTLIVVAHRLHTIASADQILVMKDGRLIERGRHDDLLKTDGLYTRMWRDYTEARSL